MNILNPGTDEKIIGVNKTDIFMSITDFSLVSILKEIKIYYGHSTWYWVELCNKNKSEYHDHIIDISECVSKNVYSTFDHLLNRAINDPYCTVYSFSSFDEMIKNWAEIKYVDTVKTIYKLKEESEKLLL